MNTKDREVIVDALKDAILREELPNRDAAKFLNFHPCYISMANNPKMWDSMGKFSWQRLEEWFLTRDKLSAFKIPDGEEIWKPKEKAEKVKEAINPLVNKDKKTLPVIPIESHIEGEDIAAVLVKKKVTPLPPIKDKILHPEYSMDTARLKVALDIEINLVVGLNGQKVRLA